MIEVIDNVISNKYSQYLFEEMTKLPWQFVPNLSYGNADNYDSAGFSHSLFLNDKFNSHEKKQIVSPAYSIIVPLLLEAFDKLNLNGNLDRVFRSRVRLTLNREKSIVGDKHVDFSTPHLVLLYYINTTDGDTIFYDNNQIIENVSPKRGRCVLFDGAIAHASSSSTLSPRLVLNNNLYK